MCNGTGRASRGGRIVVLQPLPSPTRPASQRELSLRLDDDWVNERTTVTIDGMDSSEASDSHFIIHRDGDLSSSQPLDATSFMHRFDVPAEARDSTSFSLASRFDLGVGGEGIVGRRVSLIRDQLLVGQGIVGWN